MKHVTRAGGYILALAEPLACVLHGLSTVQDVDADEVMVLGAGPIGLEMAQAFARFGSEVTVFVRREKILPKEDPDAARLLETWRKPLVESGLIGHYDEAGVGYGNISVRCGDTKQFLISGTQTGHLADTDEQHYSLVT